MAIVHPFGLTIARPFEVTGGPENENHDATVHLTLYMTLQELAAFREDVQSAWERAMAKEAAEDKEG